MCGESDSKETKIKSTSPRAGITRIMVVDTGHQRWVAMAKNSIKYIPKK